MNYAEAKREADAILRKIQTQGAHSLQLSNQEPREYLDLKLKASKRGMRVYDVIVDVIVDVIAYWTDATELLDEPRDLVNAVRAHNRSKPERLITLEESVFNYIASRKGQVAQRTFDGVCQALERFNQSFACRLDQLTRSSIKAYIQALRKKRNGKAVNAKTRNIHRESIRGFFNGCNTRKIQAPMAESFLAT